MQGNNLQGLQHIEPALKLPLGSSISVLAKKSVLVVHQRSRSFPLCLPQAVALWSRCSDADGEWEELCVIMVCLQCVRYQDRTQQEPRGGQHQSLQEGDAESHML